MSDVFRLQPLVDLSQSRNEVATRQLGQLNQQQQAEQKKLDTLLQFRKDYQEKYAQASQDGMDQARINNFQNFLNRLEEAVRQQRGVTEQANQSFQQGQVKVQETRRSMKSFETLAQRFAETLKQQQNHVEQKVQDEQSGRFAARQAPPEE